MHQCTGNPHSLPAPPLHEPNCSPIGLHPDWILLESVMGQFYSLNGIVESRMPEDNA